MGFVDQLAQQSTVIIRQRKELAELVGFETRNKYSIEDTQGRPLGFAAEQQKGILGFFLRQMVGHWRSFDILFFDTERQPVLRATHPFKFYFQKLEVESTAERRPVGEVQREFSVLTRKFTLATKGGKPMTMESKLLKIWTYPFYRDGVEVACIMKKWGGVLKEAFTDADTFAVEFKDSRLTADERSLILASAILIDLQYFEDKSRGSGTVGNVLDMFN